MTIQITAIFRKVPADYAAGRLRKGFFFRPRTIYQLVQVFISINGQYSSQLFCHKTNIRNLGKVSGKIEVAYYYYQKIVVLHES